MKDIAILAKLYAETFNVYTSAVYNRGGAESLLEMLKNFKTNGVLSEQYKNEQIQRCEDLIKDAKETEAECKDMLKDLENKLKEIS